MSSTAGLAQGDLLLAGAPDGSKICTLMQLTADPVTAGNAFDLNHDVGARFRTTRQSRHGLHERDAIRRRRRGHEPRARRPAHVRRDLQRPAHGRAVSAPTLTNSCDLASFDAFAAPANPDARRRGVDHVRRSSTCRRSTASRRRAARTVDEWVDADRRPGPRRRRPNLRRIKAVRVAIVTRGNLERETVSPASLDLWNEGLASEQGDRAATRTSACTATRC